MKLNRKLKALLASIAGLSLILVTSYLFSLNNIVKSESLPQSNPADFPNSGLFVIPEGPIGTLGVLGVLGAAFGMFALIKRRK